MGDFNSVKEICSKISCTAEMISSYEDSVTNLQNAGNNEAAEKFMEFQGSAMEQLQGLTLLLTGILYPEEESEGNLDEVDGGSVFMAGELDDKKKPIETEYPVNEEEAEEDE